METTETAAAAHSGLQAGARLLLRPEEAADAIGVSRAKFYEMLAEGVVRSIKVGRSRRVPVSELQAWLARELVAQAEAVSAA